MSLLEFDIPHDISKTEDFQSILTVASQDDLNKYDSYFQRMKERIEKEKLSMKEKGKILHDKFEPLAFAFFKYDFNGAPSNWFPEYKHEDYIIEWTEFIINKAYGIISDNEKEESGEEDSESEYIIKIDRIIESYNSGFIPDCFVFMNQFG